MKEIERRHLSGPAIRAVDIWPSANPVGSKPHQLLSDVERGLLASIASITRFEKGDQLYSTGEPVRALFNIVSGYVATYAVGPDDGEHIIAFLYPEDLAGLSEAGRYSNSARAITPVTAYILPISPLQRRLVEDPILEFHFITKLCHSLRQQQRHALLLTQRFVVTRLAMFLYLEALRQEQFGAGDEAEIYLPMSRADIAEYLGTSAAAVSRAFLRLTERRVISNRNRHHVKIIDRAAFAQLLNRAAQSPMVNGKW